MQVDSDLMFPFSQSQGNSVICPNALDSKLGPAQVVSCPPENLSADVACTENAFSRTVVTDLVSDSVIESCRHSAWTNKGDCGKVYRCKKEHLAVQIGGAKIVARLTFIPWLVRW